MSDEGALPPVLRLRVGRAWLGWPATDVEQVLAWVEPTPLPRSPSCLLGLIAEDAKLFTVIDAAELLDLGADAASPSRLVVVRLEGEPVAIPAHEVRGVGQPTPAAVADNLRGNTKLESATSGPAQIGDELLWIIAPDGFAEAARSALKS